jgi:hypothetical protein
MDRRNFFAMAGAASIAMAGMANSALAAGEPVSAPKFLRTMSATIEGSELDKQIVQIAQNAAGQFGQAAELNPRAFKLRFLFGKWCGLLAIDNDTIAWTNTDDAFGTDFKTFPLSKMLSVASKSQFATKDFNLKVESDGEVFVAG